MTPYKGEKRAQLAQQLAERQEQSPMLGTDVLVSTTAGMQSGEADIVIVVLPNASTESPELIGFMRKKQQICVEMYVLCFIIQSLRESWQY